MDIHDLTCCAVEEFEGLNKNKPLEILQYIGYLRLKDNKRNTTFAFMIFTDIIEEYGNKLKQYIKKNKLGKVTVTEARKNPNSGNYVTMWIWAVDSKQFISWYKKHPYCGDGEDDYAEEW